MQLRSNDILQGTTKCSILNKLQVLCNLLHLLLQSWIIHEIMEYVFQLSGPECDGQVWDVGKSLSCLLINTLKLAIIYSVAMTILYYWCCMAVM